MKTICLYFQIHQPFRLKRYRFFDIGNDHYYYDDYQNEEIIRRIAEKSYIPAGRLMLDMIKKSNGAFKVAFSISGTALEQMEIYTPEVIDIFRELAETNSVEFLAETYAHSLSSLGDPEEFRLQVKMHSDKIEALFGKRPTVFRNSELIYSDDISTLLYQMGYRNMITEGAKHILGWKSPNYIYSSSIHPEMKLLLRNSKFCDDISFHFSDYTWSEYPLTADKYINWIANTPETEQVIGLFFNFELFGGLLPAESGIFDFFRALPRFAAERHITFSTPTEVFNLLRPSDTLSVPYPISWAEEERDINSWTGNALQQEAFEKLSNISERVHLCNDRRLKQDWLYLQSTDHFYYMNTRRIGELGFSPYDNPYDAFNNYMNVLSDFIVRVRAQYPDSIENEELNALLTTIQNQGIEIEQLKKQLKEEKIKDKKTKTEEKSETKKSNTKKNSKNK